MFCFLFENVYVCQGCTTYKSVFYVMHTFKTISVLHALSLSVTSANMQFIA